MIWREGDWFVAKTIGLELASQGKTRREALKNLQEALKLFLENEGIRLPPQLIFKDLKLSRVYA